eukprot:TRINITY_DN11508_c0_g1_i1.p1 TRINITY_DN11508_c0_g1~~TRINITY_DN11508_c0_g1_i1.p1  ORF type:complete len:278 (-),score=74.05 TRINITY_DN11508_c0_g1_i1:23-856(-)
MELFESGEEIEKLWEAKVDSFKKIMLKLPKETKWHAMLERNEVLGVDAETDTPIAKASCKILCVYSKTQKCCTMGWASNLPKPEMHIDPKQLPESWKLPDVISLPSDQEAALVGLKLADYVGAHHMFIVPLPHAVVYLGLFSVELGSGVESKAYLDKLEEMVPHNYVIQVLDAIQLEIIKTIELVENAINNGQPDQANNLTITAFIENYANTFLELAETTYKKHNKYLVSLANQLKKHGFDIQTAEPMKQPKTMKGVSAAIVILKRMWTDSVPKTIK